MAAKFCKIQTNSVNHFQCTCLDGVLRLLASLGIRGLHCWWCFFTTGTLHLGHLLPWQL